MLDKSWRQDLDTAIEETFVEKGEYGVSIATTLGGGITMFGRSHSVGARLFVAPLLFTNTERYGEVFVFFVSRKLRKKQKGRIYFFPVESPEQKLSLTVFKNDVEKWIGKTKGVQSCHYLAVQPVIVKTVPGTSHITFKGDWQVHNCYHLNINIAVDYIQIENEVKAFQGLFGR